MIRDDFRPAGGFRVNLRRILHADGHRIAAPAGVAPHRGHQAERQRNRTSNLSRELCRASDELESIFRLLRRPSEPPSDRQLVIHESDDVRSNSPDGREVFRAVARPVPEVVLSRPDVQNPVQAVLDRPTVPNGLQKLLGRHLSAHDAVAGLGLCPTLGLAGGLDLADGLEARPAVEVLQPADVAGDRRGARLDAPVPAVLLPG